MSDNPFVFQAHRDCRAGAAARAHGLACGSRSAGSIPLCLAVLGLLCLSRFAWSDIIIQERQAGAKGTEKSGLVVPAPAGSGGAAHEDVIELLNGDKLHGTFLSLDARNGARFQHPAVRQVLSVNPATIGKISLDRPRATNSYPRQTCGVRLTNNDELVGELLSLDETSLSLSTWYAGELVIPRKMIGTISPGQVQLNSIYSGPTGIEDWTVRGGRNNEAWRFTNESFI
ncbi:MAG TPA: hypothetical protein VK633_08485, partial [Verrucomicrobiae bacterium]|nr:hypothetical protein [Verrucomicrobiae bacterium]